MPCNDECYEVHAAEDLEKDDYVTIDRDGGVRAVRGAHVVLVDYWEKLRKAVEDDESCGEAICCTADVAMQMLEAHDRGEL